MVSVNYGRGRVNGRTDSQFVNLLTQSLRVSRWQTLKMSLNDLTGPFGDYIEF